MRITVKRWQRADLVPTGEYPTPAAPEQRRIDCSSLFPAWHARARCREVPFPDDMFFGEKDDHTYTSLTIAKLREVKAFCMACPVFAECLTHALTTPERHGVWAGTSKRTRMRILALVESGDRTITGVVLDYLEGRERQYESIRQEGA